MKRVEPNLKKQEFEDFKITSLSGCSTEDSRYYKYVKVRLSLLQQSIIWFYNIFLFFSLTLVYTECNLRLLVCDGQGRETLETHNAPKGSLGMTAAVVCW